MGELEKLLKVARYESYFLKALPIGESEHPLWLTCRN